MALYNTLNAAEREKVPQVLRVWLRYRSEKYFGFAVLLTVEAIDASSGIVSAQSAACGPCNS